MPEVAPPFISLDLDREQYAIADCGCTLFYNEDTSCVDLRFCETHAAVTAQAVKAAQKVRADMSAVSFPNLKPDFIRTADIGGYSVVRESFDHYCTKHGLFPAMNAVYFENGFFSCSTRSACGQPSRDYIAVDAQCVYCPPADCGSECHNCGRFAQIDFELITEHDDADCA